jgi:hypothetical protein
MPFAFYDRLSPRRKRVYDASDRIEAVPVPGVEDLHPLVDLIAQALAAEHPGATELACQRLLDELARRLSVPPVRIKVYKTRPQVAGGELHGLYEPTEDATPPKISVWMRTAQRGRVVKFRTFLRTVLHELCHHLDYELYRLPETFHTEGFYKRESHLLKQLAGGPPPKAP